MVAKQIQGVTSEMPTLVYLIRRLSQAALTCFLIISVSFFLIHSAPGDPLFFILGESDVAPEHYDMLRESLGLNRPIHEQFFIYIGNLLRGDLGYSFVQKRPVIELILGRLPNTLILMCTSIVISLAFGIVLGVLAGVKHNTKVGTLISVTTLLGISLPIFWIGLIMQLIFAKELGWFPLGGMFSVRSPPSGIGLFIDGLWHLILPVATWNIIQIARHVRFVRGSMLEVLQQDYITMARSKGLKERTVWFRHALRNALLPVVTLVLVRLPTQLAGSVLTEVIFAWPGVGRLMANALYRRDFPVVMGILVVVSIGVTLFSLIADIAYTYLDPRIRYK